MSTSAPPLPRVTADRGARAADSPFVAMSPAHRLLVLSMMGSYLLAAGTLSLVFGTEGSEWVIPALALHVAVRAIPVFIFGSRFGWLHPVVFTSLYGFAQMMLKFPAHVWGLPYHKALPGFAADQLAHLAAYELVLNSLGLLTYYGAFRMIPAPSVPRIRFSKPRWIGAKTVLAVAVSVVVFVVYMRSQGGVMAHVLSWGQSRHVSAAGEAYWIIASQFGAFACLLWFATGPAAALRQPLFLFSAAVMLGISFLAAGSRSALLNLLLIALLIYMLRRRRVVVARTVAIALVGLILLAALGELRRGTFAGEVRLDAVTDLAPGEALESAVEEIQERRTTADAVLPILARVPHQVDLLYGESYLAVLTLPIPRDLWPEKPGLIGGRVGQTFFGQMGGVPPGPVGEAYWNFHMPGVVLVFALFGIFHRWLARLYLRYRNQPAVVAFYAVTLLTLSPWTGAVVGFLLSAGPVVLLALAFGMLVPKGGRRAHAPA